MIKESVDASYRNDKCNVECQCKNAVEKFDLTYYDKISNPLGDYKFEWPMQANIQR